MKVYIFLLFTLLLGIANAADTTGTNQPVCNAPIDVIMVLDSSLSIFNPTDTGSTDAWDKILDFTRNAVYNFSVSDFATHMSVVQFSTGARSEVCLTGTPCVIEQAIDRTEPIKGLTDLEAGLRLGQLELDAHGRTGYGSHHVMIVLTDGQPNNATAAEEAAYASKMKKVEIYTIGVGPEAKSHNATFHRIASSKDHAVFIDEYSHLESLLGDLSEKTCRYVNNLNGFGLSGFCWTIQWLDALIILLASVFILFLMWERPPLRGTISMSQMAMCLIAFILLIIKIIEVFNPEPAWVCETHLTLDILLIIGLLILYIWLYKEVQRGKYEKPREGYSRAAMTAISAAGSSLAGMTAFRMDKTKVTNLSFEDQKKEEVVYNPLSAAAASLRLQ
ncbi:hypothetical protein PCE1_003464 [Barthelona sp. PCE]